MRPTVFSMSFFAEILDLGADDILIVELLGECMKRPLTQQRMGVSSSSSPDCSAIMTPSKSPKSLPLRP